MILLMHDYNHEDCFNTLVITVASTKMDDSIKMKDMQFINHQMLEIKTKCVTK